MANLGYRTEFDFSNPRPRAEFKISSERDTSSMLRERGTMAGIFDLDYGPENSLIPLTREDMMGTNGKIKVGFNFSDFAKSRHIRLCLDKGLVRANRLLAFNANSGGTNASATVTQFTTTDTQILMQAKHPGEGGNKIRVALQRHPDGLQNSDGTDVFLFVVLWDEDVVETHQVTYLHEISQALKSINPMTLTESQLVDVIHTDGVNPTTGEIEEYILLDQEVAVFDFEGGTTGTFNLNNAVTQFFRKSKKLPWNSMGWQWDDVETRDLVVEKISKMREDGYTKHLIISGNINDRRLINSVGVDVLDMTQGIGTAIDARDISYTTEEMTLICASMEAGSGIMETKANVEMGYVSELANELEDREIRERLNNGMLVFSRQKDGTLILERDINSLVDTRILRAGGRPSGYVINPELRNNVIRKTVDAVIEGATDLWSESYQQFEVNDELGHDLFLADVHMRVMTPLANMRAFREYNIGDLEIGFGPESGDVLFRASFVPANLMERLFFEVNPVTGTGSFTLG